MPCGQGGHRASTVMSQGLRSAGVEQRLKNSSSVQESGWPCELYDWIGEKERKHMGVGGLRSPVDKTEAEPEPR